KLRPLSMDMDTSTSTRMPVMPAAINTSASEAPRRCRLVDVILQTIASDVSGEGAGTIQRAGVPTERDRDGAHVVAERGREGARGDRHPAAINDAGIAVGRVWIIRSGKSGRDEPRGVDLIPTVKAERLGFLQHDLGGAQVLARHLHGEESGGKPGEESEGRGANHGHSDGDLHKGETGRAPAFAPAVRIKVLLRKVHKIS